MKDIKSYCSKKLVALSENITPEDKSDAQIKLSLSRPTVDKYLKGDGIKIETATILIKFFTDRMNKRIKVLKDISVA